MSEETTVTADANAEPEASVDAQLETMRESEREEPVVEEVTPEPEVKTKEERVVPLAALHEERNERKRLAQELAQQRQMMETVNRRLEILTTPRPQPIDPNENPVGYLDQRIQHLTQAQEQILQRDHQREQQANQQAQYQRVAHQVLAGKAEFEAKTPDFADAVTHLNEIRARELMFHGVPESQARVQANQELDQAALQWASSGQNAAQVAYDFAKVRGFVPKAQSAEQKIQAQQKGTAAARTLGNGGAVSAGKLTAQALASMSDEDFAKLSDSQFKQAMGG